MKLKLAGAVAALAVALAGCGEPSSTGGGGGGGTSRFCTSSSCKSTETCHPSSRTCVKTCSAGADCTDEAKNCDVAVSGTVKVCSCSTDALCAGAAGTAGNICSTVDKVCVSKCTSNTDCPNGRTCSSTTGQCSGAAVADAGVCTQGSCGAGKVCTFATGACETPKTCSSAAGQPDTCPYGQFCSGSACAEVAKPTCDNFKPDAGGKQPVWNGKSTMGPIIYALTPLPGDNNPLSGNAFCNLADGGVRKTFTAELKAYNANSVFPTDSMSTTLAGLKYVTEGGNECDVTSCPTPLFRPMSGYTVSTDRKNITLKLSFCPPTQSLTSIPVGLYFTGGNEACANVAD